MHIKELTNYEFIQFVNSYEPHSIYQTPEYALTMNKQNYDTLYLGLVDEYDNIVAASLILVEMLGKFQYAYAPRGFLIDYNNELLIKIFTKLIKKFLRKKNIIAIKICPMIIRRKHNRATNYNEINQKFDETLKRLKKLKYFHLGYNNYFEAFKPRFEAIINLNANPALMFKNIEKRYRTKIRASDRAGIRIYRGTEENLKFFHELVKYKYPRDLKYFQDIYEYYKNRNMIDLYFALLDTKQYLMAVQREYEQQAIVCNKVTESIFKNQGKANNALINTKITEDNKLAELKKKLVMATNLLHKNPDGILVAGTMLIKHKNEVYLLMDGYNDKYKALNAKHLLIWKLMEKYAAEGYKTLNLGGIANPEVENNTFAGLNDFKLGFGADSIEYIGDLELITNHILYLTYRNFSPFRKMRKKKEK